MSLLDSVEKKNKKEEQKLKKVKYFSKKQRHNYKIGWFFFSFLFIIIAFFSIFNFTIFGKIIDDCIFTFLFGASKYVVYILIIFFSLLSIFSVKLHISKKTKILLFFSFLLILWVFSNCLLLFYVIDKNFPLWSSNYAGKFTIAYFNEWHFISIFNPDNSLSEHDSFNDLMLLGGGMIGTIFSSIFAIFTVPIDIVIPLILLVVLFLLYFNVIKIRVKRIGKKAKQNSNDHEVQKYLGNSSDFLATYIDDSTGEKGLNKILSREHTEKNNISILEDLLNNDDYSTKMFDLNQSSNSEDKVVIEDENSEYSSKMFANEEIDNQNHNSLHEEDDIEEPRDIDSVRNEVDEISNTRAMGSSYNYNEPEDDIKLDDSNHGQEDKTEKNNYDESSIEKDRENEIDNLDKLDETNEHSDAIIHNHIIKRLSDDPIEYELPKITLFDEENQHNKSNIINWENANKKTEKIKAVFKQFNVAATVDSINVGPQVTKFEICPEPGTKVNKILSLENDLKLALATSSLRIEAPIPNKPFIGLEIPNKKIEVIKFKSIIKNIPPSLNNKKFIIGLGKTVENEYLHLDITSLPHLLIAGTTGAGKSVCIKGIISSLISNSDPQELQLLLIDPKRVELKSFASLPHLLCPIIYDYRKATKALKLLTKEMEQRYELFSDKSVTNINSYNSLIGIKKLSRIVIIIDELADLMILSKNEVESSIIRITQMARAAGIHLIVATQRPSTDVITGIIKNNIPSRISFYVSSSIDSRTILDCSGAEKLIGRGDMLFSGLGYSSLIRAQGIYISDIEISRLVAHWTNQKKFSKNDEIMSSLEENQVNDLVYDYDANKEVDELYDAAKNFIISFKKASISLLQRRFSIGYMRASKIIDMLEHNRVIGPQNGSKPREIFGITNSNSTFNNIKADLNE